MGGPFDLCKIAVQYRRAVFYSEDLLSLRVDFSFWSSLTSIAEWLFLRMTQQAGLEGYLESRAG